MSVGVLLSQIVSFVKTRRVSATLLECTQNKKKLVKTKLPCLFRLWEGCRKLLNSQSYRNIDGFESLVLICYVKLCFSDIWNC